MQSDKVPLLKSFDVYKASLPVRKDNNSGEDLVLHDLKCWIAADELRATAAQLEAPSKIARDAVKYMAAPSGAGKTSCVLPLFLNSGFTHYLYIAFHNNAEQRFVVNPFEPAADETLAAKQGAAFIFECLKILLEQPDKKGPHEIPRNDEPPTTDATTKALQEYLHEKLGVDEKLGADFKCLVHLDEHRKMCYRSKVDEGPGPNGAAFSRGAMTALASVHRVTVVATFTEQPPLPPELSSTVCRDPVTVPCMDIAGPMQDIPELQFPHNPDNFNREQYRLWATLRFRLAMKLQDLGLTTIHRRGAPGTEVFLQDFKNRANQKDMTTALKACIRLCQIQLGSSEVDANAVKLLLGAKDVDTDWNRQVSDLVMVDGYVSASLKRLLVMVDPNNPLYVDGRDLLKKTVSSDDYLAHTPLEAAYAWALSCRAAVNHEIEFLPGSTFQITCRELLPGRLFPGGERSNYETNAVKSDVVYYAQEREGLPTHPVSDIFFRTRKGELVQVDITGGSDGLVKKKEDNMRQWIQQEQKNVADFALHGVVLAPAVNGVSTSHGVVQVVRGQDARRLLGGLSQVFRWFVP